MGLSLKLLGDFELRDAAGLLLAVPTRKTRALLGYLAVYPDKPQHRDRLMSLLWGDRSERQARHSLSQALLSIRKLGERNDLVLLDADGGRVKLRDDTIDIDLVRFRALLKEGPKEAVNLYDGPFLDGLSVPDPAFEEWLTATRNELHGLACDALERATDTAVNNGNAREAVELVRRLVALDPLREDGHRRLMRLLHQGGDRVGALRQYQECTNILKKELGVEPDASTRALHDTISRESLEVSSPTHIATAHDTEKPTVAILPFRMAAGDPQQQYFADGMAEDIITGLSRFHSINVIARNTSFSYKGKSSNVREAAKEMGVQYVLEGSVRCSGRRVRITAQLIDAETGNHLWAQRYDRELEDLFAVQDEITIAILGAIEPAIGYRERERLRRKRPDSVDAWGLYQQGLSHYYHGTSVADLEQALASFEAAIHADPGFAAAHAMRAEAIFRLLIHSVSEERESLLRKAQAAARTALRLDPEDATAHVALGWVNAMANDIEGALVVSSKALELNSFLAPAHDVRGYALQALGENEKAVEFFRRAARLSPNHPYSGGVYSRMAISLVILGRYEEAVDAAHQAMQGPNRGIYAAAMGAVALNELGQKDKAEAMVQELLKRAPNFTVESFRAMNSHHRSVEMLANLLLNAGVPK